MNKPKHRALNHCTTPMLVEEIGIYKRSMALAQTGEVSEDLEEGGYKLAQLWKVIRPDDHIVYVLAENEVRAISQACCGVGDHEKELAFEKRCFAVRVPLRIQGWGSEEL